MKNKSEKAFSFKNYQKHEYCNKGFVMKNLSKKNVLGKINYGEFFHRQNNKKNEMINFSKNSQSLENESKELIPFVLGRVNKIKNKQNKLQGLKGKKSFINKNTFKNTIKINFMKETYHSNKNLNLLKDEKEIVNLNNGEMANKEKIDSSRITNLSGFIYSINELSSEC